MEHPQMSPVNIPLTAPYAQLVEWLIYEAPSLAEALARQIVLGTVCPSTRVKYGRFYAKTLKNQHFQKFVTIFNSASSETPHLSVLPVCPSTPRGAWRMLLLLIRKK